MYSDTYEEFQKEYRVFCGTKGLCLDHLPVNLRHLYTLACKHSHLTRDTPLGTWDGVSKSVTAGFLPGQTLREQYCMYLEGFNAYTACVNNNAVSSSSPESLPKQQASSPQHLGPSPFKQLPETAGQDQKPRTKLPAKHHKLVQELHRRRGIAAVVLPACPPAAPSSAAPVTSQQHTRSADSPSDSDSPAARPSEVVTELVLNAAKQAHVTLPSQAAAALSVRAGRQVKKPVRPAAKLAQPAAKPAAAAPPPPRPPPGRRSRRVHSQVRPAGFVDSSIIVTESSSSGSESDEGTTSDNSDTDTPDNGYGATGSKCPWKLGPDYQAALPQLQQLPQGGPTPAEAKYLRQPVVTPAAPGASSSSGSRPSAGVTLGPGVFRKIWGQAATGPARVQLLEGWLDKMDQHMGQQLAQSLGLSRLGSKLRSTWAPHEEILFALGMLDKYRKFRYIRRCYLPRRSVHQLNSYYYNVWKNRAGPVPEEYAALNEDPYGDGPAWRRQLCGRLAAMWDYESLGPIPTLAQQDPTAVPAATAAAAAAAAKQQAVTAAIAGIRSVAAAKASLANNFSDNRGSSRQELAGAAASAKAVVGVKAPLAAAQVAPAARSPALMISAAIVSTEAGKQQTTNSGAGGTAAAAAIAAGIIARLTATAASPGSLTKPSAAAQAGAAAGARQQFVSGVHGGSRNTAGAAVPAGLSGMKQETASISSCRSGAITTVQQPATQQVGRLTDSDMQQASAGVPRQKCQQSQAAARYSPQSAPRAPQGVAQGVHYELAQPQTQQTPAAAIGGGVHQSQQHQPKVSNPEDASPQQRSGAQRSSGSESDSAASSPSESSSSRSCSGSQSHSDVSDTSSGSGSQQEPGSGSDRKVHSDAGIRGSPNAGPSSDDASFGSQGDDAVAGPVASMLHSSPGREQLRSGTTDASGRDTSNTSTSGGSSASTSSSDSSASSHSSSQEASDEESKECVSRGKRLAVEKSCPDGSPSVVTLSSCGSDHEGDCHPNDQHRQQKIAVGRKRRRSASRGSGVTGGSVAWSEDSDGVICISD